MKYLLSKFSSIYQIIGVINWPILVETSTFSDHRSYKKKAMIYNLVDKTILLSNEILHNDNLKYIISILLHNYKSFWDHKKENLTNDLSIYKLTKMLLHFHQKIVLILLYFQFFVSFVLNFSICLNIVKISIISTYTYPLSKFIKDQRDLIKTFDQHNVVYEINLKIVLCVISTKLKCVWLPKKGHKTNFGSPNYKHSHMSYVYVWVRKNMF